MGKKKPGKGHKQQKAQQSSASPEALRAEIERFALELHRRAQS